MIDVLGEGGTALVYRAEQRSPRRKVAITVIRKQLASPALRRRFEFDAQVPARDDVLMNRFVGKPSRYNLVHLVP